MPPLLSIIKPSLLITYCSNTKKKCMENKKITLNQIQCLHCNQIITSKHTHDFVFCTCGKVAVDGGLDYLKRMGRENIDYKELSK